MIKTIEIDLMKSGCDIICQSVNNQGKMNAGLALSIKKRYPGIEKRYIELCSISSFFFQKEKKEMYIGTKQKIKI